VDPFSLRKESTELPIWFTLDRSYNQSVTIHEAIRNKTNWIRQGAATATKVERHGFAARRAAEAVPCRCHGNLIRAAPLVRALPNQRIDKTVPLYYKNR
jgi:hypothetical protein